MECKEYTKSKGFVKGKGGVEGTGMYRRHRRYLKYKNFWVVKMSRNGYSTLKKRKKEKKDTHPQTYSSKQEKAEKILKN